MRCKLPILLTLASTIRVLGGSKLPVDAKFKHEQKESFVEHAAHAYADEVLNDANHGNVRRYLPVFNSMEEYCRYLERNLPYKGKCKCFEYSMLSQCETKEVCEKIGEDMVCAKITAETKFDPSSLDLQYIKTCWYFTTDDTGDMKDGCFTASSSGFWDGTEWALSTCKWEVESENGTLTDCGENGCEVCSTGGDQGVRVDCSELHETLTSNGQCLSLDNAMGLVEGLPSAAPSTGFRSCVVFLSLMAASLLI